ncbi:MAG: DEAD/DEAH box helicase [Polyangiaceae bacterium]
MGTFLDDVRTACLPALWSQGVKLVRESAVTKVPRSSEPTFRVKAPGFAIAPTVTLYPDDGEWSCDCNGKVDPCAHVAAAAIRWGQDDPSDDDASATTAVPAAPASSPSSKRGAKRATSGTRLEYRFAKRERLLTLTRLFVDGAGAATKYTGSLHVDLGRGKSLPPGFEPTHEDLLVDRILGNPAREVVPTARIHDIFEALERADLVTFQGETIAISGDELVPRASVTDGPEGSFVLTVDKDPALTDVVAKGVGRSKKGLHPLAETDTTGDLLERLPLRRVFRATDSSLLVTKILPELEAKIPVAVVSKRLPRTTVQAKPRIAMDLSHHGHTLSVLPTLVYGDPPLARVDAGAFVLLGDAMPARRESEERELLRKLRDELNLVPGRRVDLDGNDAIRFAAKLRDWQTRTGDERHAMIFDRRELHARIEATDGALDVVFGYDDEGDEGEFAGRRVDAATVLRAWRDGLDLVPLDGGGWAPLPAGWLAEHGHLVADLLAARAGEKKVSTASLLDLGGLFEALQAPRPMELAKLEPLLHDFTGIPKSVRPKDLTAELRPYQDVGVDWLAFLREAGLGAVLADDMGLGKTLQMICAMKGRCLVVCPKSVVHNWADEIARFRPGLRTSLYHGTRRELDADADVTLTTYAVLRLDAAKLAEIAWDVVVLDEAQAIKNPTSQTARAAFELRGAFRVALSGTPVENRLEELWSVMHFTNPGLLGGLRDFDERYVAPIARGDAAGAGRLRAKIRPFVLRRMKRDVLPDLPPRTDAVIPIELDEAERSVYDAVRVATRKDVIEKLRQGGGGSVLAALEALLRLRQAACHSSLVPGQSAESSSKIERVLEALEECVADGHKALVFSQWTSLLDLVEPHLRNAEIPFTRLDGSTRDRSGVVAGFQDEGGPPVMLVSLKAGGTGLNLTAADHVFLLDPWWNPAVEDQAADRAHRIGQDRPVMVYRLVAKDTVEERIFALQAKKRELADVALGEANHAGGITRDELLALLE